MREREQQREEERLRRKREKELEEAAAANEEAYGSAAASPEALPPAMRAAPMPEPSSPPPLPTAPMAAKPSRSRENSTTEAFANSSLAAGPRQAAAAPAVSTPPKPKPAAAKVPGRSAAAPAKAKPPPSSPPLPTAARSGSPPVGGMGGMGGMGDLSELPPDAAAPPLNLAPCSVCGRKFAEERLPKHEQACSKAANSKRKKFDVKKHRVQAMGSEAASFARNAKKMDKMYEKKAKKVRAVGTNTFFFFPPLFWFQSRPSSSHPRLFASLPHPPITQSNWRAKHESFVAAIRAAKGGPDAPPAPSYEDPNLVPCKHCGRTFNADAAARHEPICAKKTKDIKRRR